MSKTKKAVLTVLVLLVIIVSLSMGIYIDKIHVAIIVGSVGTIIIECIIGYFLGYQDELTPEELKQKINKAIYSLENKGSRQEVINILKGE